MLLHIIEGEAFCLEVLNFPLETSSNMYSTFIEVAICVFANLRSGAIQYVHGHDTKGFSKVIIMMM